MSGINFCVDTNFAIYHLSGHTCQPYIAASLAVSVVTELELLSKPGMSPMEAGAASLFLETCEMFELTPPIKTLVIALRQKHRLKLLDAIVAATACWLRVPLLTADKGFARITELDLVVLNPA